MNYARMCTLIKDKQINPLLFENFFFTYTIIIYVYLIKYF